MTVVCMATCQFSTSCLQSTPVFVLVLDSNEAISCYVPKPWLECSFEFSKDIF